jgi:hypothetical protein
MFGGVTAGMLACVMAGLIWGIRSGCGGDGRSRRCECYQRRGHVYRPYYCHHHHSRRFAGGNFNTVKAFYDGSLGFNGPENLSIFGSPDLLINIAVVQVVTIGLTAKADPAYYAMGGKIFAIDIYKRYFKPDAAEKQVGLCYMDVDCHSQCLRSLHFYLPAQYLGGYQLAFRLDSSGVWIFVTGLFWKRSKPVALASLIITWIVNLLWTFVIQNPVLGIAGDSFFLNLAGGYITLVVFLAIIITGNIAVGDNADPPYFAILESQRKALEGRT